jgi:hypothetical protein
MKLWPSVPVLFVLSLLVMAAPSCARSQGNTMPSNSYCTLLKEEVDVYISQLKAESSSKSVTVLVTKTVGYIEDMDVYNLRLAAQGRGIPTEVRADFTNKNKSSCVIQPFGGVPNLRFISKSEERRIFATGTTEFDKKYGKGAEIVAVSRVGFNSDKTLALLHVLYSASGELYLLEHKDGKWMVKFQVQTKAT